MSFVLIWERRTLALPAQWCPADNCSYHDSEPILDLFFEAQQYYRQNEIPTKVKACGFMTTDEIISMAGVDAMTLPGEVLEELSSTTDSQESLAARSVFHTASKAVSAPSTRLTYIDDKAKFDRAFITNGRGKAKTEDVSKTIENLLPATNTSAVDRGVLWVPDSGRGVSDHFRCRTKALRTDYLTIVW